MRDSLRRRAEMACGYQDRPSRRQADEGPPRSPGPGTFDTGARHGGRKAYGCLPGFRQLVTFACRHRREVRRVLRQARSWRPGALHDGRPRQSEEQRAWQDQTQGEMRLHVISAASISGASVVRPFWGSASRAGAFAARPHASSKARGCSRSILCGMDYSLLLGCNPYSISNTKEARSEESSRRRPTFGRFPQAMLARLARRLTRQPLHTSRVPIPTAQWRLSASAVASHSRYASVSVPPAVTLRPYQQECVDACLDALSSGKHRIGVSLPTCVGWIFDRDVMSSSWQRLRQDYDFRGSHTQDTHSRPEWYQGSPREGSVANALRTKAGLGPPRYR
jgi:hypothetical protein